MNQACLAKFGFLQQKAAVQSTRASIHVSLKPHPLVMMAERTCDTTEVRKDVDAAFVFTALISHHRVTSTTNRICSFI